jgi:hypothetical protein
MFKEHTAGLEIIQGTHCRIGDYSRNTLQDWRLFEEHTVGLEIIHTVCV